MAVGHPSLRPAQQLLSKVESEPGHWLRIRRGDARPRETMKQKCERHLLATLSGLGAAGFLSGVATIWAQSSDDLWGVCRVFAVGKPHELKA